MKWVEELRSKDNWLPKPEEWLDDERLVAVVGTLTRREYSVLYLRVLLGLSQREIAEVLDIKDAERYTPYVGGYNARVGRAYASALRKIRIALSGTTDEKPNASDSRSTPSGRTSPFEA